MSAPVLTLDRASNHFTLHLRGGAELPVVQNISFAVEPGECVVLGGPSGIGKSSILKMIYGNYRASAIRLRDGEQTIDVTRAEPREMLSLRRSVVGYISRFLRVIPRVSALDIVAEAALGADGGREAARAKAESLLALLKTYRGRSGPCRPLAFRAASSSA